MDTPKKNDYNKEEKSQRGGVKRYRENIIDMVQKIENEKFLNQIRIIIKRHIEKGGG